MKKTMAEAKNNVKISCLQTSQGGEFNSRKFIDFCTHDCIKMNFTPPILINIMVYLSEKIGPSLV